MLLVEEVTAMLVALLIVRVEPVAGVTVIFDARSSTGGGAVSVVGDAVLIKGKSLDGVLLVIRVGPVPPVSQKNACCHTVWDRACVGDDQAVIFALVRTRERGGQTGTCNATYSRCIRLARRRARTLAVRRHYDVAGLPAHNRCNALALKKPTDQGVQPEFGYRLRARRRLPNDGDKRA
jgi:hypothetical protein